MRVNPARRTRLWCSRNQTRHVGVKVGMKSSLGVDAHPAARSGTFLLGGDLPVHRLGFGAMRLTGKGIWGEPRDARQARAS